MIELLLAVGSIVASVVICSVLMWICRPGAWWFLKPPDDK